jgi:FG-GAP-like repeat/FG-GAP repeat
MRYQNAPTVAGVWITLLAMLSLSPTMFAQNSAFTHGAPTPYIDVISPTAARVNGPGFILILDGAGFRPGAEVNFQIGSTTRRLRPVVVNSSELAAYVPTSFLTQAATATVTVLNPQSQGLVGTSNPALLSITLPTSTVAFNQTEITLGTFVYAIVTADFNGDGKPDLAVSEPCGNDPDCPNFNGSIVILLGNGDGTFTAAASPAVNQYPSALAVGDFNGDGNTDIAVANYSGSAVSILLGDGHGGFTTAPSSPAVGGNPDSIAVGDLNGDGKLDLVVTCSGSTNVSVLLGNGDGSFTPAASPVVGSEPQNVWLQDLNRDGKLDLVVGTSFAPSVNILLGRGDGTFDAAPSPPAPTAPFAVGDVNRDGKPDLVFAAGNVPSFAEVTVSVALGEGNGLFQTGPVSPVLDAEFSGRVIADLNGDGKLDIAGTVGTPIEGFYFLFGDGHGTFNLTSSLAFGNTGNGPTVAGDFNGDGRLDLAAVSEDNGGGVAILLQQP